MMQKFERNDTPLYFDLANNGLLAIFLLVAIGCSGNKSFEGIDRNGDQIFITDRTGEKWDISSAVNEYGMDPQGFHYGLGRNAFQPIENPTYLDGPSNQSESIFGISYERTINGQILHLVASGWTYFNGSHDSFVLYDRETGSLWFPFSGDKFFLSIQGSLKGEKLKELSIIERTNFSNWKTSHPDTDYVQ